jgi:hypothetical protein
MDFYNVRLPVYLCFAALVLAAVSGCRRQESVSRYRVPKEHVLLATNGPDASEVAQAAAAEYRMLAALIPRGEQAWFFRVIGPAGSVAQQVDSFRTLVKSVHFAGESAPPEWKLPEAWRQKPGSGMRYASIEIDASTGPLDLSVTVLPRNEPDLDAYTLSNLNRWRGQLGLAPLPMSKVRESVERIELAGATATLVDLVGRKPEDNMGRAPFAGGQALPASPLEHDPNAPSKRPAPSAELTYDVPPGWQATPAGGMRKAAFAIADGSENAEVTVISLDAAGGALLANVNRWRQQVKLGEVSEQELETATKKIELGTVPGDYVELVGPEETILGVVAHADGRSWFFKMKGNSPLVDREKANFESFVRSVRFATASQ